MMEFYEEVLSGLSELIKKFDLTPSPLSERTIALVKHQEYILYVSLNLHFEIDFDFVADNGDKLISFNPLFFVAKNRQGAMPKEQLKKNISTRAEELENYQTMLMVCGNDFLSGKKIWNEKNSESPQLLSISQRNIDESRKLLNLG